MRKLPGTTERHAPRRTDPAYAPTVEMFDTMAHREIHDKVQLLKPAVLAGGQQSWGDAAAGLAEAVSQAHTEIRAAIADGWRGSGAQQAADAVYAFEQTGQDLADVLAIVSQRLGQAGDAAEALRSAVSAPSAGTPDLGAALLDPTQATTNVADQKATEHSRQDVVRAMNDIYAGVFIPTGNEVPAFLDQQSEAIPDAPGSWPASKVTGPGLSAQAPVLQPVPIDTPTAEARPVATPIAAGQATAEEPSATTEQSAEDDTVAAASTTVVPSAVNPSAPVGVTAPAAAEAQPSVAPAAARLSSTPPPRTAAAPSTVAASAGQVAVPTMPGTAGPAAAEDPRKRDERRKDSTSDAVTGLGAGAMGGLMGGAMAMGDSPRQGSSVAANAANASARAARYDDEDEDDFHFDDLPTFLEPSDDNGELIGSINPTTPPVLGEWTDLE